MDAHSRQHPDRYLSVEGAAWKPRSYRPTWSTPASRPRAASSTCRSRRSPNCSIPARAVCIPCFASARSPCSIPAAISTMRGDIREIPGLRSAHRAPGLGHQARDQERAGRGIRRRRDDQGLEGSSVRGAARRGLHLQRDHRERALRSDFLLEHHQRGVSHPAQRAGIGAAGAAESGGVLGRPFDPARRVRLHQESRLRARAARPRRVHGLRPRRHEGTDERRDHRSLETAHRQRPLFGHHRARHHRRRTAQPDRQPAGHHAGHREAPGGVRAPGARHRHFPGRRRHGGGDTVPARHFARSGQSRPCRFPVVFTGPGATARTTFSRSTSSSARRWARPLSRAIKSSSTIRPAWRARWCRGSRRCATTAGGKAIPTASIGCSIFRSNSSGRSR